MPNADQFSIKVPWQKPKNDQENQENWRSVIDWDRRLAATGRTLLAKGKLTGTVGAVNFPNIPQNYNHLHLLASCKTTAGATNNVRVVFNNDTSANYYAELLYQSNGGVPSTFVEAALTDGRMGLASNVRWSICQGTIVDYTSTHHKMMTYTTGAFGSVAQNETGMVLYQTSSPITSVQFTNGGASFDVGSTFYIYGEY